MKLLIRWIAVSCVVLAIIGLWRRTNDNVSTPREEAIVELGPSVSVERAPNVVVGPEPRDGTKSSERNSVKIVYLIAPAHPNLETSKIPFSLRPIETSVEAVEVHHSPGNELLHNEQLYVRIDAPATWRLHAKLEGAAYIHTAFNAVFAAGAEGENLLGGVICSMSASVPPQSAQRRPGSRSGLADHVALFPRHNIDDRIHVWAPGYAPTGIVPTGPRSRIVRLHKTSALEIRLKSFWPPPPCTIRVYDPSGRVAYRNSLHRAISIKMPSFTVDGLSPGRASLSIIEGDGLHLADAAITLEPGVTTVKKIDLTREIDIERYPVNLSIVLSDHIQYLGLFTDQRLAVNFVPSNHQAASANVYGQVRRHLDDFELVDSLRDEYRYAFRPGLPPGDYSVELDPFGAIGKIHVDKSGPIDYRLICPPINEHTVYVTSDHKAGLKGIRWSAWGKSGWYGKGISLTKVDDRTLKISTFLRNVTITGTDVGLSESKYEIPITGNFGFSEINYNPTPVAEINFVANQKSSEFPLELVGQIRIVSSSGELATIRVKILDGNYEKGVCSRVLLSGGQVGLNEVWIPGLDGEPLARHKVAFAISPTITEVDL